MAGVEYQSYTSYDVPEQGALGRVFNLVGTLTSVGLVAGLGFWGYQLSVRDVRDVPVIKALEGPARIQPTDPGGQLAVHQGLSVNAVQAGQPDDVLPPQIVLAPAPIDLDAQDLMPVPSKSDALGTTVSLDTDTNLLPDHVNDALMLAEKLAAGEQPLDGVDQEVRVASLSAVLPATVPGVTRSVRPASRPVFEPASFTPSAIEAAVAAAIEVDPDELEIGARLVQLGTFDTREDAAAGWEKITDRFGEYLDGKSRVIEEASSGGRAFFRLRAHGFDDLTASRRFCSVLVAANAPCIPVRVK